MLAETLDKVKRGELSAQTLLSQPYLKEALALRFRPLDWVHDDWLEDSEYTSFMRALDSTVVQRNLADRLELGDLLTHNLTADPIKRLIFVPGDQLQRLLEVLGLVCFRQQLSLLIEKRTKADLTARFSSDDMEFVQHKSKFLVSQLPSCMKSDLPLSSLGNINEPPLLAHGYHTLSLAVTPHNLIAPEADIQCWQHYLKLKLPTFQPIAPSKSPLAKSEWDRLRIFIKKMTLDREPTCTNLLK